MAPSRPAYLPEESPAVYLARIGHDAATWVSPALGKRIDEMSDDERRAECERMAGGR